MKNKRCDRAGAQEQGEISSTYLRPYLYLYDYNLSEFITNWWVM